MKSQELMKDSGATTCKPDDDERWLRGTPVELLQPPELELRLNHAELRGLVNVP